MVVANSRTIDDLADWIPPNQAASVFPIRPQDDADLLEVAALLSRLPQEHCDNREKWFGVLASLCNTQPALKELARSWSKRSSKYDAEGFDRTWDSIEHDQSSRQRRGLASLYAVVDGSDDPIPTMSVSELLAADTQVEFLADRLLVKGQPMICAGPMKSMKTTFLIYLVLCLALGTECLGQQTAQSRVLMLSGESGLATIQETVRRILATLGQVDSGYLHFGTTLPHLSKPLGELERVLVDLGTEVLVLDPAYLCMTGTDAGNMFAMGEQLKTLVDMCLGIGVTPIIAHHTTKSAANSTDPLDLQDIAWSGFAEFARQWLLINRREPFAEGSGEHKMFLKAGGSAWGGDLHYLDIREGSFPNRIWDISHRPSSAVAADAAEARYQDDCQRVLDVLDEPRSKTGIRDKAGINGSRFIALFQRMVDESRIVVAGQRSGHPIYARAE